MAACAPIFLTFLLFLLLDALFPFPTGALRRSPAVVVEDREGVPLRFFLPADERWRLPVRLEEVAPELITALVASEDRRFGLHPGVDPLAVARAAWSNVKAGRVVSGASTIPMQIARMVEPRRRTLGAKAVEAFRALQLDWHFSKRELLEIYLDLTPYGGNLEGVGAASRFLFGKPPDRLSLGEAALLTALPRSPNAYDPARHPEAARSARDRVLARLAARGAFPAARLADARRQDPPAARRPAPFAAPHFCRFVAGRYPGRQRLTTTLDRRLQAIAEARVAGRVGELRRAGIAQAAVVVVENEPRALRALVGSAGFAESAHQGQVNGAVARRSPGSALKPFLYALAFDRGLAVPGSLLLDVPTDFAGYVAENYDGTYRGRVTAREALVHSLNAPAVRLLARLGLGELLSLLRRGGLATLDRPAAEYGLPLILGGGEVTLLDLTNLYATLAAGGLHRPLALTVEEERHPLSGERLLSPEAARLVTEILAEARRPDLPEAWDLTRGAPAVAWKTGTSYGHRDAWAVGYSRRFTIGVWVGNFDGRARQGISGAEHAAPLLFDLFRAVEGGGARLEAPPGLLIEDLEVCAESHRLPTPYCPRRVALRYLPGRTRLAPCTEHRPAFVDAEDGRLLAGDCLARRPHRAVVLTVPPAELVAWWRARGQPVPEPPAASPHCRGIPAAEPPRIVSPDGATPYRLRRDAPLEFQKIPLIARAAAGTRRLYWYRDGLLLASAPPERQIFLTPEPGRHRLVVVDDAGRSDGVEIEVD